MNKSIVGTTLAVVRVFIIVGAYHDAPAILIPNKKRIADVMSTMRQTVKKLNFFCGFRVADLNPQKGFIPFEDKSDF